MKWVRCRDVVTPGLALERLVGDDYVTYGSYGPSGVRVGMWYATNAQDSPKEEVTYFRTEQEAREFLILKAVLKNMGM